MSKLNREKRQARKLASGQAKIDAAEFGEAKLTPGEWKAWDRETQRLSQASADKAKSKLGTNNSFPVRPEDNTDNSTDDSVTYYQGPGSYQGGGIDELPKVTPRPAQMIKTPGDRLTQQRDNSANEINEMEAKLNEEYQATKKKEKEDGWKETSPGIEHKYDDQGHYLNKARVTKKPTTGDGGVVYGEPEPSTMLDEVEVTASGPERVQPRPAVNPLTGQPLAKDATEANRTQTAQATGKVQNSDYQNGKVDADADFETPPPPKDDISTDLATNATNTTEEDNLDNTDGDGDGDKDGGKKKGIIPTRTNTTASTTGSTITPPSLKSGGATPNQTRGLANKNWGLA